MGLISWIKNRRKQPNSQKTTYEQNTIVDTIETARKKEIEFLNSMRYTEKRLDEINQSQASKMEHEFAKRQADLLIQEVNKRRAKEKHEEYIRSFEYASIIEQLLQYLCFKETLGLKIYSGNTEKAVLAQFNYDKLYNSFGEDKKENLKLMFLPYMQELEKNCGIIDEEEYIPKSVKKMYEDFKKDTRENQVKKACNALYLQTLGIVDFEDPECFKESFNYPNIRKMIVDAKRENNIIKVREKLGLADQLPTQYKKCIKVKETTKTEKKPSIPRSYLNTVPPDGR